MFKNSKCSSCVSKSLSRRLFGKFEDGLQIKNQREKKEERRRKRKKKKEKKSFENLGTPNFFKSESRVVVTQKTTTIYF